MAHAIPALYRKEHPGDDAESLGADDFLPIFIFVLVNSKVEGMAAQAVIVESLCDPKKMMGEAGETNSEYALLPTSTLLKLYHIGNKSETVFCRLLLRAEGAFRNYPNRPEIDFAFSKRQAPRVGKYCPSLGLSCGQR